MPNRRQFLTLGLAALAPPLACAARPARPTQGSIGGGEVAILVDAQAGRRPISPLLYGVSYAEKNAAAMNCPVNRSGGNNTSRYNWKLNADNRAGDWFFQSIAEDDPTPSGRIDAFLRSSKEQGARSMITVPLIGWVADVAPDRGKKWSFSVRKYGPQEKTDAQYCPDAGNGMKPDGKTPITGNDPKDANVPAGPEFMRPWVEHLTKTFGPSGKGGGVDWYLLDNEPGIWHGTHRDVRPEGIRMDELWTLSRDTAAMIKSVDPTAKVAGPEEWGWTGYLYSGYDAWWAAKNSWNKLLLPDRRTHGGMDMAPWYLKQFAAEEKRTGKRLLDLFTLHIYPQGGEFSEDTSPEMQARRNRSTRSLWDPHYKDETWINDTVRLIPRMKEWVAEQYPGTPIGITEYSWGAEGHMNGATAQADILGIFGREGLDVANRWVAPDPKTPTFKVFQLYRNYDGKKSTFGDTSVSCVAPDPDDVSAFAAQDSKTGALTVMVVAKASSGERRISLQLANFAPAGVAQVYQLTEKNAIEKGADLRFPNATVTLTVPAPSVTLLVLPKKA
jgi:Alpha-L-arabinofuranosidase